MTAEVWRDIAGYVGRYMVSNLGNVRSFPNASRSGVRLLKGMIDTNGYRQVLLRDGHSKRPKAKLVNRLVAEAFLPNPKHLPYVNHIDENPLNNTVGNLEWCDAKYNANYGTRTARMVKAQMNDPRKSRVIVRMSRAGEVLEEYPSLKEAQRSTGVRRSNIAACANGRKKTAGGFIWKYGDRK